MAAAGTTLSGGIGFAVGLGAMFAPRALLRLYGIRPSELTGVGELGWRLFAARNLVVGAATLSGSKLARDVTLAVQAPDQAAFMHAYRTRAVPRPAALAAMATSAVVIAGCVASRAADARASRDQPRSASNSRN